MSVSARTVAGLIAAALMWDSLFAAEPAAKPLVFNMTAPTNDLQGSLSAQVRFAQRQIVPVHPRKGDNQPYLISQRKSLLLVQPLKPDGNSPMHVTARGKGGKLLGSLTLDPPEKLPKTAYDLDGIPDVKIDFTAPAAAGSVINNRRDLEKLSEPEAIFLHGRLRQNALVEIQTADGRWVRDIYVPSGSEFDGKFLRVRSNAGYGSTVHYSDRTVAISRGQTLLFKSARGQWILVSDLKNQGIRYANDTWSGVLPADWIVPGLNLQIRQVNLSSTLTDHDPSKGDWHNGTMRQSIGKELISLGIDNANYGINSTASEGEGSHRHVAARNSVDKYVAGIVVHDGSGNRTLTRVDAGGGIHELLGSPGSGGLHFLPDESVLMVDHVGLRRLFSDGRVALLADGIGTGELNDLSIGAHEESYFSVPKAGNYRLTSGVDGTLIRVSDQGCHGLEVDPSGEFLYVVRSHVQRYAIDIDSKMIGEPETVFEFTKGQGGEDGCTFDAWENLSSMHFRTGWIRVIDPNEKKLLAEIPVSVVPATNLTFGRPRNTEMFVTAGAPKHKNCQVLKTSLAVTGFCGHVGATS